MADYRMDCCGGYPSCKPNCKSNERLAVYEARKADKTALLDQLYARYGELVAHAERTSHNVRQAHYDKADGVLMAIRIIEGQK